MGELINKVEGYQSVGIYLIKTADQILNHKRWPFDLGVTYWSLSAAIRPHLRSGDMILADVTLTFAERLSLANQFKILEALDPKSAGEYSQSREIVEAGYQYLYETINPSISTVDMPVEASQEVAEILDMFRALEHSSKEIGKTTEELEVSFEGFDANNEDRHYHFARFTRRKLMNWSELDRYPDNSQTQSSLPRYRTMVERWRAMGKPHKLSESDIAVLSGR